MARRIRFLALYFSAWLPVWALYAVGVASQRSATFTDAVLAGTATTLVAALLGLAVWRIAQAERLRGGRAGALGFHLLGAVVYAALWNATIVAQIRAFAPPEAFQQYIGSALAFQLLTGLALYAVVASAASFAAASRAAIEQREAAVRADALRVEAELRALRAQLDPHFLFNTLHTITSLVRTDHEVAASALQQLADMLRYVLAAHDRSDEVTFDDELRFVRAYLELERLRHGDRLRVEWRIDDEATECRILSFTLQALVENAVRHAVGRTVRGATVEIGAQLHGERLRLWVRDDGPGASSERIDAGGIGLRALRKRLEARFGRTASFEISTVPGDGFAVTIECPVLVAEREAVPG